MFGTHAMIVEAFESCEFIAGSAEVEWRIESETVKNSLKWLAKYARNPSEPNVLSKEYLAQALHGMIAVAKAHYAEEGYSEYWPYLENQINNFYLGLGFHKPSVVLDGPRQRQLGQLFLHALRDFKLSLPAMGQTYIGPIIFHAGLPDHSVEGLLRVVLSVVDEKQEEALRLSERERSKAVSDYQPAVHRSVQSIFQTSAVEVTELWQSLVRVALAWRKSQNCSTELQELPPFVNPEKVYEFLIDSVNDSATSNASFSRPEVRYDPLEGQVRLLLRAEHWPEPSVKGPLAPWKAKFHQVGDMLESICFAPLPNRMFVESPKTGAKKELHVMSDERHGIWFDGKSGKMVTADQLNRFGLTPGIWFLLILGEPSRWNVRRPTRSPLSWSFYESGRDWTAWAVDVPERSTNCTHLEFRLSDIQEPVRIHLAKKPGPRVEFVTQPVHYATNASAGRFAVFPECPKVRTHAEKGVALNVSIWSDSGWNPIGDLEIPPGGLEIPIEIKPGCYRLTEKRGIGREVARLAHVPGLKIKDPEYDDDRSNVRILCEIDEVSGRLEASENIEIHRKAAGLVQIRSTTVEPQVRFSWNWNTRDQPPLTFAVEVAGLRWRVTGLRKPDDSKHPAELWCREPVYLSKTEGKQDSGRLEIQYPTTSFLTLDSDASQKLTDILPNWKLWEERLRPFVDREALQPRLDGGEPFTVLVISDRPRLRSFGIEKAGQEIWLTFDLLNGLDDSNSKSLILLAWKVDDPSLAVFEQPLSNEDIENGFLILPTEPFESHETTAFAIARKIQSGFGKKTYLIASYGDLTREPFGIRFEWAAGSVWASSDATLRRWEAILHQASLEWLEGRGRSESDYRNWFYQAETEADFAWASALIWIMDYRSLEDRSKVRTQQIKAFASVWSHAMIIRLWQDSCVLLQVPQERWNEIVHYLFDEGVTLGQGCPERWKSKAIVGDDDLTVYPFQWIRDLATVSVWEWPSEYDARNAFEDLSDQAVKRLWQRAEVWGMTRLFELLPSACGTCQNDGNVDSGSSGRHHHLIKFKPMKPQSALDLIESLGVKDLFLDVSSEDQRRNMPQPVWLARKSDWVLEFPERNNPKCCTAPEMVCPFPEPHEIASLEIAKWIQEWSRMDASECLKSPDVTMSEAFGIHLKPDERIGQIQNELQPDLQPRTQSLFGQRITLPERTDSSPKAQTAWRMAWIERSFALAGQSRSTYGGGYPELTEEQLQAFQRQFAESLRVWPELMKRTIALAEFLIRIYRTEGIGRGFRQSGDYSAKKLADLPKILVNPITSNGYLVQTEPRLITDVEGVFVSYDRNNRFAEILVKHPSHASIQVALNQYLAEGSGHKNWLACLHLEDVRHSEVLRINREGIREQNWIGLRVKCQLVEKYRKDTNWKKRKWWAKDVHFFPNFDRCTWH
jgi:hypothetical protein